MPTPAVTTPDDVLVSIIIANFNYAAFIAEAIDSALALDWPAVEVIVVDDGSTDHSRDVIESYGGRIRAIFQANQGQVSACNRGFAASSGQWIIFLDSDDRLHPDLLREVAAVWRPGVSKIQCQMLRIDSAGRSLGMISPSYEVKPDPASIRRWASTTSAYPTPPGSGNTYATWYIKRLFPLDPQVWDFTDSPCLAAAPYLGDVETIIRPLVYYRIHGRNDSQMVTFNPRMAVRDLERAQRRSVFALKKAAEEGIIVSKDALSRSLTLAGSRMISRRFAKRLHPVEDDTRLRIIFDSFRAAWAPQGLTVKSSLSLLLWNLLVGFLPAPMSVKLVSWRYTPSSRPPGLIVLLEKLLATNRTGYD